MAWIWRRCARSWRPPRELHLGRTAGRLFVTQQALSKRVARLEDELGVRLFSRGTRAPVELTEAGAPFPGARPADPLATSALTAPSRRARHRPARCGSMSGATCTPRCARYGHVLADLAEPRGAEPASARDYPARGDRTAARRDRRVGLFGRVHPRGAGNGYDGIAPRLVRLEPLDAVLGEGHPLAGRESLRAADLAESTLVLPAAAGPPDYLGRFTPTGSASQAARRAPTSGWMSSSSG